MTTFPSPCGDYGSYQIEIVSASTKSKWVSVPLRGLWFLSIYSKLTNIQARLKGFRPLAGIMVLIFKCVNALQSTPFSFRPLAGIMVLILEGRKVWNLR